MKISNTNVYALEESIVRSGYAMLADIDEQMFQDEVDRLETQFEMNRYKDNQHFKRAVKLGNAPIGSGHDSYLKGIIVQADFEAPQYWWQQAQRYHWFDIISSQSKMHRILQMDLDEHPNIGYDLCSIFRENQNDYKQGKITLEELLDEVPMGLEYTAGVTTNYLQLKTMYCQRKTHRLHMWNTVFKQWVESLPYFKELCLSN